jgi:hypothetical protein
MTKKYLVKMVVDESRRQPSRGEIQLALEQTLVVLEQKYGVDVVSVKVLEDEFEKETDPAQTPAEYIDNLLAKAQETRSLLQFCQRDLCTPCLAPAGDPCSDVVEGS